MFIKCSKPSKLVQSFKYLKYTNVNSNKWNLLCLKLTLLRMCRTSWSARMLAQGNNKLVPHGLMPFREGLRFEILRFWGFEVLRFWDFEVLRSVFTHSRFFGFKCTKKYLRYFTPNNIRFYISLLCHIKEIFFSNQNY